MTELVNTGGLKTFKYDGKPLEKTEGSKEFVKAYKEWQKKENDKAEAEFKMKREEWIQRQQLETKELEAELMTLKEEREHKDKVAELKREIAKEKYAPVFQLGRGLKRMFAGLVEMATPPSRRKK